MDHIAQYNDFFVAYGSDFRKAGVDVVLVIKILPKHRIAGQAIKQLFGKITMG